MNSQSHNTLSLGNGIYTVPDVANILRLPYATVNKWLNEYWDGKLGKSFQHKYSWRVEHTRAVSFYTLVEFYIMMQFSEAGVRNKRVLEAHEELSKIYQTAYPFAHHEVLRNICTDGKNIFWYTEGGIVELDGKKQFHIEFIEKFLLKLDFRDHLAARLWPLGKGKSVVCDPHHKFGQPVISGTNIQTAAIYQMFRAKEPLNFIASIYELPLKSVKEAILYHEPAA